LPVGDCDNRYVEWREGVVAGVSDRVGAWRAEVASDRRRRVRNREVVAEFRATVRTVEATLTKVYAQLGLRLGTESRGASGRGASGAHNSYLYLLAGGV
jgi:hypothetical protein